MDIERLSQDLGFDAEATRRLLRSFVQSTEKDLAALEGALASADAASAGRAAHHIKGAAANLELTGIAEAAAAIEAAARSGAVSGLADQAALIRTSLASVRASLA